MKFKLEMKTEKGNKSVEGDKDLRELLLDIDGKIAQELE
jgi:hypothetical protein